jgi:3',5'-cyclic-AMP phosphodiesterase
MIVAQLSDLHIDAAGSANAQRLQWMLATLERVRPRPALLLLTGDLTEDGSSPQYALLRDLLQGFAACLLLPGNHDDAGRLHSSFPKRSPPPGSLLSMDVGDLAVLAVDSTVPGRDHGEIAPPMLQAMTQAVESAGKPMLLAFHHPPVSARVPALEGQGLREPHLFEAWLASSPGVAAVLTGHHHQAQFSVVAGRPVLVAPSVAPSLLPDFGATRFRTEAAGPAGLLHLWQGQLSSHLVLAAPSAVVPVSTGERS